MCRYFSLEPSEQLNSYNSCLKEAARRVRNESLYKSPDGTEERKLVLFSVSRALWFNNLNLAKKLIDYSATAKDLIDIEEAQVKAHSFETFETIFGDFFNVYHSSQVQQLRQQMATTLSTMQKKQLKCRLQCARRMLSVFWKRGGRLKLAGIETWGSEGNSCIVTSPKQVQFALAEHWAPAYSKKVCSFGAAKVLLRDYQRRNAELIDNFSRCQLPPKTDLLSVLKTV